MTFNFKTRVRIFAPGAAGFLRFDAFPPNHILTCPITLTARLETSTYHTSNETTPEVEQSREEGGGGVISA